MRRPKPNIIVLLAVLVAAGVLMTTAAQAQGIGGAAAAAAAHPADWTCLLCPHGWQGSWALHLRRPSRGAGETAEEPPRLAVLDYDFEHRQPYGGGVHYDFWFNRLRAILMGGNMDVTLRLDNYHHPIPQLDPYLSISLGGRW